MITINKIKKLVANYNVEELLKYFYVVNYTDYSAVRLQGRKFVLKKDIFKCDIGDDTIWYEKECRYKDFEINIIIARNITKKQKKILLKED